MVEVVVNWKLRVKIFSDAGVLIDTIWPGNPRPFHPAQQLMIADMSFFCTNNGYDLQALDSTSGETKKPSSNRRVYDLMQA